MMRVYGVEASDDVMRQMAKLIQLSAVELQGAIRSLRKLSNGKDIDARVIEVNRRRTSPTTCWATPSPTSSRRTTPSGSSASRTYEELERATDRCETVANIISDIVIRHS